MQHISLCSAILCQHRRHQRADHGGAPAFLLMAMVPSAAKLLRKLDYHVDCCWPVQYQFAGSRLNRWPVGLMDKASAPGAGDSRFESWAGHSLLCNQKPCIKFNT